MQQFFNKVVFAISLEFIYYIICHFARAEFTDLKTQLLKAAVLH